MTQKLHYFIFKTDAGWMGLLRSEKGLLRSTLPQKSAREAGDLLGALGSAEASPQPFGNLVERLTLYFSGKMVSFPDEVDFSGATLFQRMVWEATRQIPYGETRSYSWLARYIDKPAAPRAAGQALSQNPLPIIIPCHRVLSANGKLGGFSGGLDIKKYLLSLESTDKERRSIPFATEVIQT